MIDRRPVVAAKRDGATLPGDEIEAFVEAYVRGDVSDALAASFLMACAIRGLDAGETLALTRAIVGSGRTVDLRGIGRPTVDKHSTGGVSDGVTLVFAPLAAAVGLGVAKLSGHGLGHTGGTIDKLESIPGLRTDLDPETIARQVSAVGCAVAAQSPAIAPADGKLYALRDATATVESVPLLASSIMSKKLAVVTDLILLDVKVGSGAFMTTLPGAQELARACLDLARSSDRPCRTAITDMSQPLGRAIGNALDVAEAISILRGDQNGRLRDLAVSFVGEVLTKLDGSPRADAEARCSRALEDGSALDRFRAMVEAQGGDATVIDEPWKVLPRAPVLQPVLVDAGGVLAGVDAARLGRASGALGAGRLRKGDPIDPAVGVVFGPEIGDRIAPGEPIGEVHARDEASAERAADEVRASIALVEHPVESPPLVHAWME